MVIKVTTESKHENHTQTHPASSVAVVTGGHLNFEYIIHVSLYRRSFYGKRPPIKSAILATDATLIHYGKVHALLTQGSPIKVRVFQDRNEVAQWLGAPLELLTPKGDHHQ